MHDLMNSILHADLPAMIAAVSHGVTGQAADEGPRTLLQHLVHFDDLLLSSIKSAGGWAYLLMFGVIYAETGFVIFPFLPGDSFLLALGILSADDASGVKVYFVIPLLIAAAILGNSTNYVIGRWAGPRIFRVEPVGEARGIRKILTRDKLDKASAFFERHGGKAVTMAQFIPFMRCLVPFVAGMGRMEPTRFMFFNWLGAVIWVGGFVSMGYFAGQISWLKAYTSEIFLGLMVAIVVIVATPPVVYLMKRKKKPSGAGPVVAGGGGVVKSEDEFLDVTSKRDATG